MPRISSLVSRVSQSVRQSVNLQEPSVSHSKRSSTGPREKRGRGGTNDTPTKRQKGAKDHRQREGEEERPAKDRQTKRQKRATDTRETDSRTSRRAQAPRRTDNPPTSPDHQARTDQQETKEREEERQRGRVQVNPRKPRHYEGPKENEEVHT